MAREIIMPMKRLSALLLVAALSGCAPKVRPTYRVVVHVESDPGVPLAGVNFSSAGLTLGQSNAAGEFSTELQGDPGDVVPIDLQCPEGHRSPAEPLSVLLRRIEERDQVPEFQVKCPPATRQLVIAVRANNGVDLPLRYLGQEIARTSANGAAHAVLRAAPGDTLTFTLDTSAPRDAKLMPQQPELKVTVPERDDVVLFDQPFIKPKPKPKPPKPPPPPPPEGPQRI